MTRRTIGRWALLVVPLLTAACSSGGSPASSASPLSAPTKALVVVLENHAAGQALDQMPRLRQLGRDYARATHYSAVAHPSLPNYLAIVGGSTYGVTDNAPPAAHPLAGPSVFGLALGNGRTAKLYAEAMTTPCAKATTGRYAVKHNAWVYFADAAERAGCASGDVAAGTPAAGALAADAAGGRLPQVGMLVPDLCHDGHDCSLKVADDWLAGWMDALMGGPDFRAGRLAIIVTFDEDDEAHDNQVLTTVVAPRLRQRVVDAPLTHFALHGYLAELAGAGESADDRQRGFSSAFGLTASG